MADEFDSVLTSSLAPAERAPDRAFVLRVQATIKLEERLAAERRALAGGFVRQLLALAAVAVAAWWISKAPAVASWIAESQAIGLAILLAGFAFVVGLIAARTGSPSRNPSAL
jgi:FtsH-binding integral membrane protein